MELKGAKVLLTGGHGFLGRYIHKKLVQAGADVVTFHANQCDLRDDLETTEAFSSVMPDLVIHAAARVGGIGANQKSPADFFLHNMRMGLNVLEAAAKHRTKKLVLIGTTCSYPHTPPNIPFKEGDLFKGYPEPTNAPYGIAKRALFVGALAFRKQHGLNSVCLIPANLYGPGDNFDVESSHVIPALIRKFSEAVREKRSAVKLWGTGMATRTFLHAEDCADGILLACERYDGELPINLAADFEISIRELAAQIANLTGFTGDIEWDAAKPDGQPIRRLDTTLAKQLLGFVASKNFNDGLKETVEWWRNVS